MIKVVQLGLGPIGQRLTQYLSEREGIKITAGIDPDPQKVGQDVALLAGLEACGVSVEAELKKTSAVEAADVAVISTVSSLQKIEAQIQLAAEHKLDVVTTCEELAHPWKTQPEIAHRIEEYCRKEGVSCLATGVNPGFLMDYLPSVLTSVCQKVDEITVERIQDAGPRRKPFQDKIGVGLTEEEFEDKRDDIRHVGLEESVYMLAEAMQWELDSVTETMEPVKASQKVEHESVTVPKGKVAGVRQEARGYREGQRVITAVFEAAVGTDQPHDTIDIKGNPSFTSTIQGGVNGDIATSAIMVNAIRSVCKLQPGLGTMLDIPVPSYFSNT